MAITRATGKACRLAFSWIMTLAGYDPTPAEELVDDQAPKRKKATPKKATRKKYGKVLGHAGATRLLDRLDSCGKTWADLVAVLKAEYPETHRLVAGQAFEKIPESALEDIARVIECWADPIGAALAGDSDPYGQEPAANGPSEGP